MCEAYRRIATNIDSCHLAGIVIVNYQLTRGLSWLPYGQWHCESTVSFCARYLRKPHCVINFCFQAPRLRESFDSGDT